MGDKSKGLYHKFDIRRTDGKSEPGKKHHGCNYFVLDLTHDRHALKAIYAYADSCLDEYPLLSADLLKWADRQVWIETKKAFGEIHGKQEGRK